MVIAIKFEICLKCHKKYQQVCYILWSSYGKIMPRLKLHTYDTYTYVKENPQALCIISEPSVNFNWSYSPETPN